MATQDVFGLGAILRAKEEAGGREDLGMTDEDEKAKFKAARTQVDTAYFIDDMNNRGVTGQRGVANPASAVDKATSTRIAVDDAAVNLSKSTHGLNLLGVAATSLMASGIFSSLAQPADAQGQLSSGQDTSGFLGQSAAMALAFSDPKLLLKMAASEKSNYWDKAATIAVTGASLGAGVLATQAAHAYVAEHVHKVLGSGDQALAAGEERLAAKAGIAGLLVSSAVGLGVGGAINVLGTAIMQHFGLMRGINPIPEAIAQFTVLSSLITGDGDDAGQDMDDQMGMDDESGSNQEGVITLVGENGEVIDQEFYVANPNAVDDNGSYDSSQMMDSDLDTFISSVNIDSNSAGADDTLVGSV